MEERKFKGVWIPKEIWLEENLTLQEKVVLVEIDSLSDEDKGCFASNNYFAKFFKISPSRIAQIISELKNKDYITTDYIYEGKEIKERQIKIKRPPYPMYGGVVNKLNTYLENYRGGIEKTKGGYLENCKDNNTYINNTYIDNKEKYIKRKSCKPTIEEIKEYCLERKNGIDPNAFYDFYESKDWYVGKNKVKDWKACIRTWEHNKKKQESNKEELPEWFDKDVKQIETSEEEKRELEELLKNF